MYSEASRAKPVSCELYCGGTSAATTVLGVHFKHVQHYSGFRGKERHNPQKVVT